MHEWAGRISFSLLKTCDRYLLSEHSEVEREVKPGMEFPAYLSLILTDFFFFSYSLWNRPGGKKREDLLRFLNLYVSLSPSGNINQNESKQSYAHQGRISAWFSSTTSKLPQSQSHN